MARVPYVLLATIVCDLYFAAYCKLCNVKAGKVNYLHMCALQIPPKVFFLSAMLLYGFEIPYYELICVLLYTIISYFRLPF